ncbi:GIY-YIG nuclease family protein [Asaia sp. As-1742]|uniref:GIY-YIG nuclease family protein n=1 Tax=Asaia sp. As-1742 TaxID=2608325 RepID=UPI001420567A|nr:GIY-YIG nuclease family protein [Asaia sp. As-1742]NIE81011.1 GIY-YIG nuclease family protein [Asaia sp. As-1742]
MAHPQTIQIFLPDGDPQGIRIASITTRIVQLIEIPRLRLADFLAMSEAGHVGLYLLFGEDDETGHAKAYIGQTGNLGARLKQHHDGKDFWNRALVALSLTHSLTVTHAHYLEWLAISRAAQAARCKLENSTTGTRPHTPAAMEAECREIFETIDILLTTLGHPVFEALVKREEDNRRVGRPAATTPPPSDADFFLRNERADARGRYTEAGFIVLAGSWGRAQAVPSFVGTSPYRKRQAMIEAGDLAINEERLVFLRDVHFNSPSAASDMVSGRATNGWTEWKDATGKTLSDVTGRVVPTRSATVT